MGITRPDGPPQGGSDIAQEWQQALAEFEAKTGKNLSIGQIHSMKEAMDTADAQKKFFKGFRHDDSKIDKVRSAFSNNIGLIQKIVDGAQQAANAAGAFPPAMPIAPLMTAFTYVFQTFKDISADFDRVMGFFDEMRSFLDRQVTRFRLSCIESDFPEQNFYA